MFPATGGVVKFVLYVLLKITRGHVYSECMFPLWVVALSLPFDWFKLGHQTTTIYTACS